jgi:glycosyltransferase involved in cell wall biosynthesis
MQLKVFYLWDFGVTAQKDHGFGHTLIWDIPLLSGYEFEFVPNVSQDPGTHHWQGLQNPHLYQQVLDFKPDAVIYMVSYNYWSSYQFLCQWKTNAISRQIPLFFRGDSHRLHQINQGISKIKDLIKAYLISLIFSQFNGFFYVGKANYNYFISHGVTPDKLFYTPHSINNELFSNALSDARQKAAIWREELAITQEQKIILFVGKLESTKNPFLLLKSFKLAKLQNVSLLFVGAGQLEAQLKNYVQQDKYLAKSVYFAPFQNQSQMPRSYAIADLLVLPSSGETWGLVVNEAMCMELPVIVSSHVGCAQDLVIPNYTGLVFQSGNVHDLADKLQMAFRDHLILKQWGKNAADYIKNYSYANILAGIEQGIASYMNQN